MLQWLKNVFGAIFKGTESIASNKMVQAAALAGGEAALSTMSPQTQAVATAVLAIAPTVNQLVAQVQATHDAVQLAAKAIPAAAQAAAPAAAVSIASTALASALADHQGAMAQLTQMSTALNTVVGVAQALQAPAPVVPQKA